jgi:hypothetical protein
MGRMSKEAVKGEGTRDDELVEVDGKEARRGWFRVLRSLKRFSRAEELDTHG